MAARMVALYTYTDQPFSHPSVAIVYPHTVKTCHFHVQKKEKSNDKTWTEKADAFFLPSIENGKNLFLCAFRFWR